MSLSTTEALIFAAIGLILLIIVMLVVTGLFEVQRRRIPIQATIDELEAKRQTLSESMADLEREISERRAQKDDASRLQAEVGALIEQKKELETELSLLDDRRAEIREIQGQTEEAVAAHAEAARDLRESREELEAVRARAERAEGLSRELPELEEKASRLREEIQTLERDTADLRQLRDETERLRDAVKALERDHGRIEGEVEAARERVRRAGAERDEIEAGLPDLRSQAAQARADAAAARDELDRLGERFGAREAQRAALEQAVSEKAAEERDLSDRVAALRKERDEVGSELGDMRQQVTMARSEWASARSELEDARERKAALDARLAALEQAIEEKERRSAELAHSDGQPDSSGGSGATNAETILADIRQPAPALGRLCRPARGGAVRERDALQGVRTYMKEVGLSYPGRVIDAFHTAMKVNDTAQMTVLAGISGTGKSQLPRRYAEGMGLGFLQVAVQPRWDSPQDLMGFYNYIEGRYRATDLARVLWQMDPFNEERRREPDLSELMMLVLLDEMNLARVEYYFSEFLSRLESRPTRKQLAANPERRDDASIEIDVPGDGTAAIRLFPGHNILFAGTMNEDESTQTLSDKVVDRANVMRFAAPKTAVPEAGTTGPAPEPAQPLERNVWEKWLRGREALGGEESRMREQVDALAGIMAQAGRPFGFRLGAAMLDYVANYPTEEGHAPPLAAMADQVELRLLPKLRGVETDQAGPVIEELASHVRDGLDDGELADAIRDSLQESEKEVGRFVWRGVRRA